MKKTPLVTILINNYNYADFLDDAIESALNQDYTNTEVIVVDDGSQDDSHNIIDKYGDSIRSVIKENGGQASAFNAGVEVSHGEIICFLDADDTFKPNKVSGIAELFGQYPDADWIFHKLPRVDPEGNCIPRQGAIEELRFIDLRQAIKNVQKLPFVNPATTGLSFRTSLLKKIFPMPEAFRISADSFLCLASICNSPGVVCPQELAIHRIHGKNLYEYDANMLRTGAEIRIRTAWYLQRRYPESKPFSNRLFSRSFGHLAGLVGYKNAFSLSETKQYIQLLLGERNPIIWIDCTLCVQLHFFRTLWKRFKSYNHYS
ncbi:MAG: glycosyltransferase [Candidatus Electrothrix aestuarii]|uniref:Glycosyltransferase n=1 Tax=Candidatus Electrothrix aestuarii TaxID=3062594 RepID=A0AAU8M1T8_9BACT|nr:glycosyltransferase [Candidatus Electrothrix aestuarii]